MEEVRSRCPLDGLVQGRHAEDVLPQHGVGDAEVIEEVRGVVLAGLELQRGLQVRDARRVALLRVARDAAHVQQPCRGSQRQGSREVRLGFLPEALLEQVLGAIRQKLRVRGLRLDGQGEVPHCLTDVVSSTPGQAPRVVNPALRAPKLEGGGEVSDGQLLVWERRLAIKGSLSPRCPAQRAGLHHVLVRGPPVACQTSCGAAQCFA